MARTRKPQLKICSVTGLETSVDNLRRTTNATKEQMQRMFNQINQYV